MAGNRRAVSPRAVILRSGTARGQLWRPWWNMKAWVVLFRNKEWPQKMYGLLTGFLEKNEMTED